MGHHDDREDRDDHDGRGPDRPRLEDHDRWRVRPGGSLDLADHDTGSKAGAPGDEEVTEAASAVLIAELAEWQNRLWAEARQSLLVVLQAMDAGGKDGAIRKVFTGVNPQGVRVQAFKAPTPEELAHDFLWRIHHRTPAAGEITVFNRSHYEDVLVVRVEDLVPKDVWKDRYGLIRDFERLLAARGTRVVKLFLHISADEQRERFQARLDDPAKRWKFAKADLDVRAKWDRYQEAYADALAETTTHDAPWYVIPADHKWYRDWAVLNVLLHHLRDLDPQYPAEEPGLDDLTIT